MTRMKGASGLVGCSVVMSGGHLPVKGNVAILGEGVKPIEIVMCLLDGFWHHTVLYFLWVLYG